jgi:DUF1680 family protein
MLQFRIPAWAQGASIAVNGKRIEGTITPGTFAPVRREWRNNDRIEIHLPLSARLEPIDRRHPRTVALLNGPLVLFAIENSTSPITRSQLLAATKIGKKEWSAETSNGKLKLLPFTEVSDETYSTYLNVT